MPYSANSGVLVPGLAGVFEGDAEKEREQKRSPVAPLVGRGARGTGFRMGSTRVGERQGGQTVPFGARLGVTDECRACNNRCCNDKNEASVWFRLARLVHCQVLILG